MRLIAHTKSLKVLKKEKWIKQNELSSTGFEIERVEELESCMFLGRDYVSLVLTLHSVCVIGDAHRRYSNQSHQLAPIKTLNSVCVRLIYNCMHNASYCDH